MGMQTHTWEDMLAERQSCAEDPPQYDDTAAKEASTDEQGLRFCLRKAKKRRAVPEWALPLEVWWLCLHPGYRLKDKHLGVGADRTVPSTAHTRDAIRRLLRMFRAADTTPLMWHRSLGCPIDKPGDKPDARGSA